jgi:uncharacterized membrane protein
LQFDQKERARLTERERAIQQGLRDTNRLEAFSDGVIAIAITLLVLEVHVPDPSEISSNRELWQALKDLWPEYVGYLLSFIVIGIMWANHHNIFKHISNTDHNFIVINTLLLLCIGFVPFTTDLLAEYLGEPGEKTAMLVYAGWFTFTACIYNLLWRYPQRHKSLLMPDADEAEVRAITRRFNFGPPLYFVTFLLALVSVYASLIVIGLLAVLYLLPVKSSS